MSLIARAALIFLSTGAFYFLAVLGWGSVGDFFLHPAFIALSGVGVVMAIAALFVGGNVSRGEREDRGNRWVLAVFTLVGLLIGYAPAYADRHDIWTLDGESLRWIGVALFAVGCVLRMVPVIVLGDRFSGLVAIQPGHRLVTSGIYGVIRHPSYLGLIVTTVGWVLAFRSGVGLVLCAAILVPVIGRIRAEEELLRSQFGQEYDTYRARTWRLIPLIY